MLHELGTLCLAPVVLVGYLASTDFRFVAQPGHSTDVQSAAMIEVQTCERGLGFDAKVASNGLYGAGLQYGFHHSWGAYSATVLPKAGFSYTVRTVRELPQDVQFGIGAQLLLGYKEYRLGIELWHLSNAGITSPNIGLNLPIVQVGIVF